MNQKKKSNLIKAGVVFGTVFWINMGWLYYSDCQQENFKKAIDNQQEVVYNKDIEIKELNNVVMNQGEEITTLTAELETLKGAKVAEASNKPSNNYRTITASITHYTHTGNPTASGSMPIVGRTVACNFLPLGSKVKINGCTYVVEDRVGLDGPIIDIFVNSEEEALNLGRYTAEVTIVSENKQG